MATGKVLTGCVREQTAQCLGHIKTIVESIGHVMDDIVKVNIQLKNIEDLEAVNAIYTQYFLGYTTRPHRDRCKANCPPAPWCRWMR